MRWPFRRRTEVAPEPAVTQPAVTEAAAELANPVSGPAAPPRRAWQVLPPLTPVVGRPVTLLADGLPRVSGTRSLLHRPSDGPVETPPGRVTGLAETLPALDVSFPEPAAIPGAAVRRVTAFEHPTAVPGTSLVHATDAYVHEPREPDEPYRAPAWLRALSGAPVMDPLLGAVSGAPPSFGPTPQRPAAPPVRPRTVVPRGRRPNSGIGLGAPISAEDRGRPEPTGPRYADTASGGTQLGGTQLGGGQLAGNLPAGAMHGRATTDRPAPTTSGADRAETDPEPDPRPGTVITGTATAAAAAGRTPPDTSVHPRAPGRPIVADSSPSTADSGAADRSTPRFTTEPWTTTGRVSIDRPSWDGIRVDRSVPPNLPSPPLTHSPSTAPPQTAPEPSPRPPALRPSVAPPVIPVQHESRHEGPPDLRHPAARTETRHTPSYEIGRAIGADLDAVAVHRGTDVDRDATRLSAHAWTEAGVVHLPAAAGTIDGPEARALIAHELVHVVQQRHFGTALPDEASPAGQHLESQALAVEGAVRSGAALPALTHPVRADVPGAAPADVPGWQPGAAVVGGAGVGVPHGKAAPARLQRRAAVLAHPRPAPAAPTAAPATPNAPAGGDGPRNWSQFGDSMTAAAGGMVFDAWAMDDPTAPAPSATPAGRGTGRRAGAETTTQDYDAAYADRLESLNDARIDRGELPLDALPHDEEQRLQRQVGGGGGDRPAAAPPIRSWGEFREAAVSDYVSEVGAPFGLDTAALMGAAASPAAAATEEHTAESGRTAIDTDDLDLDEIAAKLYDRIRSRLRLELLLDRERAGLLSDFR